MATLKSLISTLEYLNENLSLAHYQAITLSHNYSAIFEQDPETWARFTVLANDIEQTTKAIQSLTEELKERR